MLQCVQGLNDHELGFIIIKLDEMLRTCSYQAHSPTVSVALLLTQFPRFYSLYKVGFHQPRGEASSYVP